MDGVEAEDGLDHGPVKVLSAISHHGKDQDGSLVEERVGGYLADHGGRFHGMDTIHG